MTNQADQSHYNQDHGSFLPGFTVGLLAGAVGYFLFGTKKGKDISKNLAKEWKDARKHMEKEGGLELKDADDVRLLVGKGLAALGEVLGGTPSKKKSTKRTSKSKAKKKTTKKFKGT